MDNEQILLSEGAVNGFGQGGDGITTKEIQIKNVREQNISVVFR